MKTRPILFNGAMVLAILAGVKTQTRRAVNPQPEHPQFGNRKMLAVDDEGAELYLHGGPLLVRAIRCPYGLPGDRLWVREAWRVSSAQDSLAPRDLPDGLKAEYVADGPAIFDGRIRPGMFMPRWASRITLEITDVRVERLQDISEDDARAEGFSVDRISDYLDVVERMDQTESRPATCLYRDLWDEINGDGAWDANPWVWAISFKRVTE